MKMFKVAVSVAFLIALFSCASLTPSQFLDKFPNLTNSDYYDRQSGNEAISNGKCNLLVEGRKYVVPIGVTANNDVKNGA